MNKVASVTSHIERMKASIELKAQLTKHLEDADIEARDETGSMTGYEKKQREFIVNHHRKFFLDLTAFRNAFSVTENLKSKEIGLWRHFETYHESCAKYLHLSVDAAPDIYAILAFLQRKVLSGFGETLFPHRKFVFMQLQTFVVHSNEAVP